MVATPYDAPSLVAEHTREPSSSAQHVWLKSFGGHSGTLTSCV